MRSEGKLNEISRNVIGVAIAVHKALGPGLLESAYQACLAHEMKCRAIKFDREVALPIIYRDVRLDCGYRLDFVVEEAVVVELKSVEKVLPIHKAQLLSYLRLANHKLGLLINFNVQLLTKGVTRIINNL